MDKPNAYRAWKPYIAMFRCARPDVGFVQAEIRACDIDAALKMARMQFPDPQSAELLGVVEGCFSFEAGKRYLETVRRPGPGSPWDFHDEPIDTSKILVNGPFAKGIPPWQ